MSGSLGKCQKPGEDVSLYVEMSESLGEDVKLDGENVKQLFCNFILEYTYILTKSNVKQPHLNLNHLGLQKAGLGICSFYSNQMSNCEQFAQID